jgi:apolipoprotein N-acyltransferase
MNTTTSTLPKEKLSWWWRVSNSRWFLPLLAATSILFFWLGWPVLPFAPLLFLAFVPILIMEQHITADRYRKPGRKLFGWWYLTLLGWNLTTTWWVVNSTLIGGIFANLANALLMCIPLLLFRYTKRRTGPGLGYMSFVLYWITFENIHLTWDLSWPWLTLGNGFAMFPEWVQWYEWTGVFGGSLWILLGNLLAYFLFWHVKPHFSAVTAVVMLLWVGLPILGGYIRYWSYVENGPEYEAVVLQPNIDPFTEKFAGTENFIPYEEQVRQFVQQSQTKLSPETDFLLWPETAIDQAFDERYLNQQPIIQNITEFVNSYPQLSLLTGITSYSVYDQGPPPATARFREGFGHYDVFNTAYFINGNTDSTYHKSKLVPGPELLPYPQVTRWLSETVFNLGGSAGGFGRQAERTVFFNSQGAGIAPSICYESVYGDFMAEFIRNGANFIFIITNDGWWGNTAGHKQHFHYARLRAIETRRSIARCANTGISGFINQRGDVLQETRYWEPDVIKGSIRANETITFYAAYGDYLGRTAGWIAPFLLLAAFVRKRILRK